MEKDEQVEVVMSGIGGQGVLTIGQLLAAAGGKRYKHVFYLPNYATAKRGGDTECIVTLSNEPIFGLGSLHPPAGIALHHLAFESLQGRVRPNGLLIVDSSIVADKVKREDLKVFYIPATELARDLGSVIVANLILLGAYLEETKALPLEIVYKALEERLGARESKSSLLLLNKQALRKGAELLAH